MNIAFVTELFYPSVGGQENRFFELASKFVSMGHSVSVYTIDDKGTLPTNENIDGFSVKRVIKASRYRNGIVGGRRVIDILRFTLALRENMKSSKFDFVFVNQWPVLPAIFSGNLFNSTLVVLDFVEFRSGMFWSLMQWLMFRSVRKVTFISSMVQTRSLSKYKCIADSCVIPSLVEIKNYRSAEDRDCWVYLGRMQSHKHPEMAIESYIIWRRTSGQKFPLKLIGDGDLFDLLKVKYGEVEGIEFLGFVSDEVKIQVISKAIGIILPSEREGLPKSVIECMASATPAITTDYPDNGTKQFVQELGIGLVSNPDAREIADKMQYLFNNFNNYSKLCLDESNSYDIAFGAEKILKFVKEI